MTLVIAAFGSKSLWLAADRRLTFSASRFRDDAMKMAEFGGTDGTALIGYAGLGETAAGVEPSDWIVRTLLGPKMTVEQGLNKLAAAVPTRLTPRLLQLPRGGQSHVFVAPAYVDRERRLFVVEAAIRQQNSPRHHFKYHELRAPTGRPPPVVLAGSGANAMTLQQITRPIRQAIKAAEAARTSFDAAARAFARVIKQVAARDRTVSEACFVSWRLVEGGGGSLCIPAMTLADYKIMPTVAHGMNVGELVQVTLPYNMQVLQALLKGEPAEIDGGIMRALANGVRSEPDDELK